MKGKLRHCASGFQRGGWSAAGKRHVVDQGGHLLTQSNTSGRDLNMLS